MWRSEGRLEEGRGERGVKTVFLGRYKAKWSDIILVLWEKPIWQRFTFFWFNLTTFENCNNTFFKTRYMLKKAELDRFRHFWNGWTIQTWPPGESEDLYCFFEYPNVFNKQSGSGHKYNFVDPFRWQHQHFWQNLSSKWHLLTIAISPIST